LRREFPTVRAYRITEMMISSRKSNIEVKNQEEEGWERQLNERNEHKNWLLL